MQFETALLALLASATSAEAGRIFGNPTPGRSFGGGAPVATPATTSSANANWICQYFPSACQPKTSSSAQATVGQPTQTLTLRSTSRTAAPTTAPPTTVVPTTPTTQTAAPTNGPLTFPYYNQQTFVNQMLSTHNTYRARHGVAPLTWNTDLANQALSWAKGKQWMHTPNNANGENLATGTYTNPAYYVFMWYDEVKLYNYNNPGFSEEAGHFTQVVWNSTTQVGCAMTNTATDQLPSYTYYLVCEYSPPGNIVNAGYFANNVYPASGAYPAAPPQFLSS